MNAFATYAAAVDRALGPASPGRDWCRARVDEAMGQARQRADALGFNHRQYAPEWRRAVEAELIRVIAPLVDEIAP